MRRDLQLTEPQDFEQWRRREGDIPAIAKRDTFAAGAGGVISGLGEGAIGQIDTDTVLPISDVYRLRRLGE
jgi:hypothetical protein